MKRLLILILLAFPAPAHALSWPEYDVDITGIQVTDWRYLSAHPLPETWGYTTGEGSQTIGFRTTRKGRLGAMRHQRLTLMGMDREPRIKGTVKRSSRVIFRPGPPVCEGGKLDPECANYDPTPKQQPQECRRQDLPVNLRITSSGNRQENLTVTVDADTRNRYANCGPDSGERSRLTEDLDEREVMVFDNVARRLNRLRVGRTVKIAREAQDGCPFPAPHAGFDVCRLTDVTLEITRRK